MLRCEGNTTVKVGPSRVNCKLYSATVGNSNLFYTKYYPKLSNCPSYFKGNRLLMFSNVGNTAGMRGNRIFLIVILRLNGENWEKR